MLKVTEMDLATARNHVQQFQEISQANESALATLNATHDEYKASTEAQIARLEVCVQIARSDKSLTNINLVGS
jgi:nucleoprotein TPR